MMMTFSSNSAALAIEYGLCGSVGEVRITLVAHQPDVVLLADRQDALELAAEHGRRGLLAIQDQQRVFGVMVFR